MTCKALHIAVCILLFFVVAQPAAGVSCRYRSDEGFKCDGSRSVYCGCTQSRSYSGSYMYGGRDDDDDDFRSSGTTDNCRITSTTTCGLGCHSGKCLQEGEVCGAAGQWGANRTVLNYDSATCALNGKILPAGWTTWKDIQDNDATLSAYQTGVDSDRRWFNRQLDTFMFNITKLTTSSPTAPPTAATETPTAASRHLLQAVDTTWDSPLPKNLYDIIVSCQEPYEKFTCMRNMQGCKTNSKNKKGTPDIDECVTSCEWISTECFGRFFEECEVAKSENVNPNLEFDCVSLRDSECWEPWCTKNATAVGGILNQGWYRECKYMCMEFQRDVASAADSLSLVVSVMTVLVVGLITKVSW